MNVGLIFGIIFAAIVIGLVAFFGISYIGDMGNVSCMSQVGQQITNLEAAVRTTLSLSQGSSEEIRLIVPGCLDKFCFVDPEHTTDNPTDGWSPEDHVEIMVRNEDGNVVIYNPSGTVDTYKIDKVKPYVNFCIESSEELVLRNQGTFVEVALPEFYER